MKVFYKYINNCKTHISVKNFTIFGSYRTLRLFYNLQFIFNN